MREDRGQALTKFINHRPNPITLLHPLIRNTQNPRRIRRDPIHPPFFQTRLRRNRRQHARRQERIRHGFHIDVPTRSQLAHRRARHGRFRLGLHDFTTHGFQHVLSKTRIALQRRGPDVLDRARRSRDGCDGERVRRGRRVGFDVVRLRVRVRGLWDLVHVEKLTRRSVFLAGDGDSEGGHHGDGHVDVRLGDDLASGELEDGSFGTGSVRRAEEDGGDVLAGDARC